MAISDNFQGVFGDIFSGTLALTFWITIIILGIALIGGLCYYFFIYKKRFDILCKIISARAGDDKVYFDYAAILKDKKNQTDYLKLWNSKIELEIPRFNIFHHTNKGDYVELLRNSERDFKFLTAPKIDKDYFVKSSGKLYPFANIKQKQIESDISWTIQRLRVNKKLIDPESLLMKLLAFTPQIVSAVISMMILWIVIRYAPELLNAMKELATELKKEQQVEVIGSFILGLIK